MCTFDSNYKMSPPLRTEADVKAIIAGLVDGTLEVIATDHAPHAPEKKMRELDQAPNGIIGLETLLPICIKALIEPGILTWPQLIDKLTINPARVLGIARGTLKSGEIADVTVIDPEHRVDHRCVQVQIEEPQLSLFGLGSSRPSIGRGAGWQSENGEWRIDLKSQQESIEPQRTQSTRRGKNQT